MHIHILGICGTFMAGIALLARARGLRVTGSDTNVYPPMSTQLAEAGIEVVSGYDPAQLKPAPDVVVIGNALSRTNPAVEYILNNGLRYTSGPQWLAEQILQDRWVLAVSGTHGKTTTASILAWILQHNTLQPGYLIGGIPTNFNQSAYLGQSPFFVVEADEYDTAFFDKRSKFIHYHPRTLVINNIEFDHADIFADLAAIQTQFHHLVRTVPGNGLIIRPAPQLAVDAVLERGCWTPIETVGPTGDWQARLGAADGSEFEVWLKGKSQGRVTWNQLGLHNVANALAAVAAARHVGVPVGNAIESLSQFSGVKRRMEVRGIINAVTVYDDFAHHPTAIETTLDGLRHKVGTARIIVALELRSNTMRMGVHAQTLAPSLHGADRVLLFAPPSLGWDTGPTVHQLHGKALAFANTDAMLASLTAESRAGDHIVIMSNGGFENLHARLLAALQQQGVPA
ncbi:MAG: UDP-N-acetylmuramate:L-alanyl-gamma-D-glutamyl-meso-diaminopimelate ligase [Gammaproteobacteria bacterium]|nr:UDP-N-acetylmuramate:L-alanyl-gamma-D-glutamyl-meso-diaminopimelate ligase [Gammaproteobacteria bacterium]